MNPHGLPRQILSLVRLPFRHSRLGEFLFYEDWSALTISEISLLLRGVRVYSFANILLSALLALAFRPRLSTPLFEFPLLALLHLLVLGGILPLLMLRWIPFSLPLRLGLGFTQVGTVVLVVGFLLHPRSGLPMEGGILVSAGILLALLSLPWSHRSLRFWFILWISSAFGVFLGGVLARPTVDPIPFSAIAVHAILGGGLGLFALGWLASEGKKRFPVWEIVSLGLLVLGVGELLRTTLVDSRMAFLAGGALLVLLEGVDPRGRIVAIVLAGGCLFGERMGWLLPGEWISALAGSFVLGGLAGVVLATKLRRPPPVAPFR